MASTPKLSAILMLILVGSLVHAQEAPSSPAQKQENDFKLVDFAVVQASCIDNSPQIGSHGFMHLNDYQNHVQYVVEEDTGWSPLPACHIFVVSKVVHGHFKHGEIHFPVYVKAKTVWRKYRIVNTFSLARARTISFATFQKSRSKAPPQVIDSSPLQVEFNDFQESPVS